MGCEENSCGGKVTNARCTRYEGELSNNTTIQECSKPSVHDVLEDVSGQLNELANQLDLTSLEGECLQIDGDEVSVKDYLQAIINRICSFTADCDVIFNTPIECAGFDYKCFVDACGDDFVPSNLKELIQMLIDRSCEGGDGGCNCAVDKRVFYYEGRDSLIPDPETAPTIGTSGYKAVDYSYTITPQDGDGNYELTFHSGYHSINSNPTNTETKYGIYVNNALLDPLGIQTVSYNTAATTDSSNLSTSWFQSQIPLTVGDTIGIYISNLDVNVQHNNILITKIGQ